MSIFCLLDFVLILFIFNFYLEEFFKVSMFILFYRWGKEKCDLKRMWFVLFDVVGDRWRFISICFCIFYWFFDKIGIVVVGNGEEERCLSLKFLLKVIVFL